MPERANARAANPGAAVFVLADEPQYSSTDFGCHGQSGSGSHRPDASLAARWLISRFGVKPALAGVVAELAGLAGRAA